MIPNINVDLSKPAELRWEMPLSLSLQASSLMKSYINDLGGLSQFRDTLEEFESAFISHDHQAEIRSIATQTKQTIESALLGNLYYDAAKLVLGCTAFAVDSPQGPLHARNLDWWTENKMLSSFSLISNFLNSPTGHNFSTVGWPGFIGALSGVAPGRFAISLNAVLSDDPSEFAQSISFLIRTVFENAYTFDEAVKILSTEKIATDCLLLVTGVSEGEMLVIERTPTKSEIRNGSNGFIALANDYMLIDADTGESTSELQATSCGRYNRAVDCLKSELPNSINSCFDILQDNSVQMGITVQQMVFCAKSGDLEVRIPTP